MFYTIHFYRWCIRYVKLPERYTGLWPCYKLSLHVCCYQLSPASHSLFLSHTVAYLGPSNGSGRTTYQRHMARLSLVSQPRLSEKRLHTWSPGSPFMLILGVQRSPLIMEHKGEPVNEFLFDLQRWRITYSVWIYKSLQCNSILIIYCDLMFPLSCVSSPSLTTTTGTLATLHAQPLTYIQNVYKCTTTWHTILHNGSGV